MQHDLANVGHLKQRSKVLKKHWDVLRLNESASDKRTVDILVNAINGHDVFLNE